MKKKTKKKNKKKKQRTSENNTKWCCLFTCRGLFTHTTTAATANADAAAIDWLTMNGKINKCKEKYLK